MAWRCCPCDSVVWLRGPAVCRCWHDLEPSPQARRLCLGVRGRSSAGSRHGRNILPSRSGLVLPRGKPREQALCPNLQGSLGRNRPACSPALIPGLDVPMVCRQRRQLREPSRRGTRSSVRALLRRGGRRNPISGLRRTTRPRAPCGRRVRTADVVPRARARWGQSATTACLLEAGAIRSA